jgi:hypothetical protein
MSLQSAFYILAIVFLAGWIVFLTLIIIGSFLLYKKGQKLQASLNAKINSPLAQITSLVLPLTAIILPLLSKLSKNQRRS